MIEKLLLGEKMKKKAILMVLLFALITSLAMSSQLAYCENSATVERDVSTAATKTLDCDWHGYIIHRTGFPKPIGVPWLYNYKTNVDGHKQLCVGQGSTLLARSYFRGFGQWYIADIPSDADVTDVKLRFYVPPTIDPRIGDWVSTYACDMDIYEVSKKPPSAWGRAEGAMLYGDFTLFDDAYDGHLYTWEFVYQGDGWVEVDLGPQAELDLEARLSGGIAWFAVGFHEFTDHADGTGVERGVSFYCVYLDVTYTVAKLDTVLDFWFTPNPAKPGESVQLKGTLKTVGGSPVYPAQVRVEYSTDGGATWHYIWTLNTNAAGEFSKTFPAPGVGEYLVRVSYLGSAVYNPSSDTETLIVKVEPVWGDYHFRINPWIDVMHIKISGKVIYGIDEAEGSYYDQPVLGYIEGNTFYVFVDFQEGEGAYELMMLVGSTSTLSGNAYRTTDGTSWVGPTSFSLTSVSLTSDSSTSGQALASTVEPESWPPTYHFRLSPFLDVVHLSLDGSVLHGQCDATTYQDQPVMGYVSGNFFIFAIDYLKDGFPGLTYELSITVGSVSTLSGNMYRTVDGKSWVGPTAINLVSAPP